MTEVLVSQLARDPSQLLDAACGSLSCGPPDVSQLGSLFPPRPAGVPLLLVFLRVYLIRSGPGSTFFLVISL